MRYARFIQADNIGRGFEQPSQQDRQELKAPDEKFPLAEIKKAGYGAIWHGQRSWNGVAILARDADPVERRRGLPGDPEDMHSRYIEAQIGDLIVGCLYLPNGNPAPGPKFDYKLRWFDRLTKYAKKMLASNAPVVLAGDYNVMPTDLDVYKPERWLDDALFRPEVRKAFARLTGQAAVDTVHVEGSDLHWRRLARRALAIQVAERDRARADYRPQPGQLSRRRRTLAQSTLVPMLDPIQTFGAFCYTDLDTALRGSLQLARDRRISLPDQSRCCGRG